MSIEANKAIVRRLWEEVWNQNKVTVCDEIFDAAYAAHEKQFLPRMKAAFPDMRFIVHALIAEDDKVVTHLSLTGTHQGTFMGVPASGRPVNLKAAWIHRLEDGRIVEGRQWGFWDRLAMLEQLGALPGDSGR